ncbi:DUF4199 domain-containing protein [Ferruginibacter sp. HRS2-29]|uniref:DUF4199 domain-containing protein n=1 Tax=Ferruginibacter sp. HRS2-29 TaxID=2487334 RepID=UPI0020CE5D6A|nr:DUF4199 domain-containing protein [Ferruginibacter sp. HRS2-29]MCP9752301.1 DUF4199 domain-containing protein [Ferruginibacter sp. HRS2-29]
MKRNVLVFGLISGLLLTILLIVSINLCYNGDNYEGSMVVGYAGMLISFSMIFVAVKNYRDKYNQGIISFGKAFKIGLFICLIGSSIYVLVWMIDFQFFVPDYLEKYSAHVIADLKASGASEAKIAAEIKDMNNMNEMYKNPLIRILMTYAEILPIGLLVSLISALILKKKAKTV